MSQAERKEGGETEVFALSRKQIVEELRALKEKLGRPVKMFLICPVRGHKAEETLEIYDWLVKLGVEVHWPPRHTVQDQDAYGGDICGQNRKAIEEADIVGIANYEPTSQGSHFDAGMAFALRKLIIPLTPLQMTEGKSYPNMFREWYAVGPDIDK